VRPTLFTSESVTEGHPDKIADQISDSVLDHLLAADPRSRVACETLVTTGLALVAGEVTTTAYVHVPDIVRGALTRIGYTNASLGIDAMTCAVLTNLDRQSPDIAQGVDTGGAGDQGMMFGYATDETPELMPATLQFAHALTRRLAQVRRSGEVPWIRPDGKAQVTVEFEGDKPVRVHTVVVSTQHDPDVRDSQIAEVVRHKIIKAALPPELYDENDCILHINPTGRFVIGGPHGDCGLTGRKIIVDTYGGVGSHGGGSYSGKDPSKVDRSASYMARHVAKNIVAAALADRVEVQVAYAIGVAEPVSVMVDTLGTGKIEDARLTTAVREVFPLTPRGIISYLDLLRPIYKKTAAYGHFGRNDPDFTWERTDRVDDLITACKV